MDRHALPTVSLLPAGLLLFVLAACGGDGAGDVSGPGDPSPEADFALATLGSGLLHVCGVTTGGDGYCWGTNSRGHLGTGEADSGSDVPVPVAGDLSFTALVAGDNHTCGLASGGEAYCWGWDTDGQRGDGQAGVRDTVAAPAPVVGGLTFESLSAGRSFTCGVTPEGVGYCWGDNGNGQLGIGTTGEGVGEPTAIDTEILFERVDAGTRHACGLTPAGAAYCWGNDDSGQLGTGSAGDPEPRPVAVAGGLSFRQVSAGGDVTCGVTDEGTAYCWGNDGNGELGDGSGAEDSAAPVQVSGELTFRAVAAAGSHVCGVTDAGPAYCWGYNDSGQLGDGATGTSREVPTAVVGDLTFEGLALGENSTCGWTGDGAGYCWGANDAGQLGDGNEGTPSDRPVRVADPG